MRKHHKTKQGNESDSESSSDDDMPLNKLSSRKRSAYQPFNTQWGKKITRAPATHSSRTERAEQELTLSKLQKIKHKISETENDNAFPLNRLRITPTSEEVTSNKLQVNNAEHRLPLNRITIERTHNNSPFNRSRITNDAVKQKRRVPVNKIQISSTDDEISDDDDVIFVNTQNGHADNRNELSYDSLCKYSKETCDFCDRIFNNRYKAIQHVGKHIIIPLLRPTLFQCDKCLYYFTSDNDIKYHKAIKHPDIDAPKSNNKCTKTTKITSRIIFEDDEENDNYIDIMNIDLTNDIKYDEYSNIHNGLGTDSEEKHDNVSEMKARILLSSDDNDSQNKDCRNNYDSLLSIGDYKCRYCRRPFSTRYRLLRHNLQHITIKKPKIYLCPYCEGFFETNKLRQIHMRIKHNENVIPPLHQCCECNLPYFSWFRHNRRYHEIYICGICKKKRFKRKEHLLEHFKEHEVLEKCSECNLEMTAYDMARHRINHHNDIKVCDTCSLFLKDRGDIVYIKIGVHNENGKRNPCEQCGKMFFDLNVIRRIRKKERLVEKLKDKIRFQKLPYFNKPAKPVSNTDRLKNIRDRLKKLNQLNKF